MQTQGTSEDKKFAAETTQSKTDSSSCFGISPNYRQKFNSEIDSKSMEKRTLLFLFAICLSFVLVQTFFGPSTTPSAPPPVSPKKDLLISSAKEVSPSDQEQFYVLENNLQQLVFSTRGGSLAEINLPFGTVKELEVDRKLKQKFPLHPAMRFDQPQECAIGGYYPLLRRSSDSHVYGLNLVSEHEDLSSLSYRVTRFEKNLICFEADADGNHIRKTFSISENNPYSFELDLEVNGNPKGLWITSGVPEVELVSGSFLPSLRYQVPRGNSYDLEDIELSDKKPTLEATSFCPDWISNSNGFLGIILTPLEKTSGLRAQKIPALQAPTRLTLVDNQAAEKYPGYLTFLPVKSGDQKFRVFAGPFDRTILKQLKVENQETTQGDSTYENAQSQQGWFSFISQPFSQFLSFLLDIFYKFTHSWGISIILLTIALRLMLYPLDSWSIRSRLKIQELAPEVKAIQDRYKKDPKKGQLEVMNLYRERGANPFSGCLPMLLQTPFLFGMFYVLKSSFPLRGASFIPGWINNLAAPDVLFTWGFSIWFIGNEFHLLPVLTGIVMYVQQKITTKTPKDEKDLTDMQRQQKMMSVIFPIFLTLMFYNFPSGLNIYFLSSTLLGLLQQWIVAKQMKKTALAK